MKLHNITQCTLLLVAIYLLLVFLFFQNPANSKEKAEPNAKQEDIIVKRALKTQDGINFCLTVIPVDKTQNTFAIVTITNMSDKVVIIPTPQVMPLSGTLGYKNTIQLKNENGELLSMTGLHTDYTERPTTKLHIPPATMNFHSRSWCYELEDYFPDIAESRQYTIDFRLLSEEGPHNKSTWKGTVDLSVTITKDGPYKIESQSVN